MGRMVDLARRESTRLQLLERRNAEAAERRAVRDGVAETVRLEEARGGAFEAPEAEARGRERPYRRQPGLEWLSRKGRLSGAQRAAGERYGACYRRARADAAIPSSLDVKFRGGPSAGAPLDAVLLHAEGTANAGRRLALYRGRLWRQPDLVRACDLICGEELTPREAAGGDREALRLETLLIVALDVLAAEPQSGQAQKCSQFVLDLRAEVCDYFGTGRHCV